MSSFHFYNHHSQSSQHNSDVCTSTVEVFHHNDSVKIWECNSGKKTQNSGFFLFPFGLPVDLSFWFCSPAFYCETNKQILGSPSPPGSAHGFGWRSVFVGTDFFKARFFSVQRASFAFLIWFLSNLKNHGKKTQGWFSKNRIITSKLPSSVCT